MQKSSTEFTLSRRAMDVWLIAVPNVGTGGFVTPCVPVAMTPAGKEEDAARTEATALERKMRDRLRGAPKLAAG